MVCDAFCHPLCGGQRQFHHIYTNTTYKFRGEESLRESGESIGQSDSECLASTDAYPCAYSNSNPNPYICADGHTCFHTHAYAHANNWANRICLEPRWRLGRLCYGCRWVQYDQAY